MMFTIFVLFPNIHRQECLKYTIVIFTIISPQLNFIYVRLVLCIIVVTDLLFVVVIT